MMEAVLAALDSVIKMIGTVVTALVGTDGALAPLLPLLAIGIGISGFMFAIKAVRSLIWGA